MDASGYNENVEKYIHTYVSSSVGQNGSPGFRIHPAAGLVSPKRSSVLQISLLRSKHLVMPQASEWPLRAGDRKASRKQFDAMPAISCGQRSSAALHFIRPRSVGFLRLSAHGQ